MKSAGLNPSDEYGVRAFMRESPKAAGGAPLHPDITSKFKWHPGGSSPMDEELSPGGPSIIQTPGHYQKSGTVLPLDRSGDPGRQIQP